VPGNIVDILSTPRLREPGRMARSSAISASTSRWSCNMPLDRGIFRGDLGYSYISEKPALAEILPRIRSPRDCRPRPRLLDPSRLPLASSARSEQNTALDYVLRIVSLSGLSMPALARPPHPDGFVAMFGTIRSTAPSRNRSGLAADVQRAAAAVGFRSSALIMRLTRSSMLEVLRQDISARRARKALRTARSTITNALRTRSCRSSR